MNKLTKLYRKTGWHTVFSFDDEATSARTYLLAATGLQSVVSGLTTGVFYTGFLLGFGINIVNLSILTVIPYITSLFSLLTPYILDRFPKRRMVLSVARMVYYTINILGITLLPRLVVVQSIRIVGLIIIVFVANSINFLFSGYSPWHMPYITPEIRTGYFSATAMASNLIGTGVALLTSLMTESMTPVQQLRVFSILRIVAFGIAALDVYFLQKPKEPVYILSSNRPSLVNIIKLPLANKKFALTMLVYFLYTVGVNLAASVITTWQLQTVKTGYVYPSVINVAYPLFVITTSSLWGRVMRKLGNFKALSVTCFILSATYFAYAFVNHDNFLWLMTVVRLVQHGIGMLQHYSVNNLIYLNLPKEDQTCYTSFYTIIANLGAFLSMSLGTWVVARMDQLTVRVFTVRLGSVPLMLLAQGVFTALTAVFVLLIRKYAEPEGRNM